jgi:hypothetical protein
MTKALRNNFCFGKALLSQVTTHVNRTQGLSYERQYQDNYFYAFEVKTCYERTVRYLEFWDFTIVI